ncbi:hypothetical protein JL720_8023 [Aureococcus anophagefferens]|nr:hypothetical protein JL720_8023 [Aureococcus anophagefferens]
MAASYTRYRLPDTWTKEKHKLAFTVDGVMSPEECGALVSRAAAVGWKPSPMAPLQMGHRSRFDDAELASTIFERLRPYCPAVHLRRRLLGLTPTFRFIKYAVGASVSPHPDTSGGDKHTPVGDPNCSLFTCLLYLNDGYEGCETCLLPSPGSAPPPADAADDGWPRVCEARGVAVPPRAGRVLVFEHDILHACPPLRAGEKLVVRVDLCYEDVDLDGKRLPHPFRDSTLAPPPGARVPSAGGKKAFAKLLGGRKKESVADRIRKQLEADAAAKRRRDAFPRPAFSREGLAGRAAVVTGASAGIGAALAEALALEVAAALAAAATRPVVGDVCDAATVAEALRVAAACDGGRPPRLLVNNAGLADGATLRGDDDAIAATFGVNALAPATWTRAYLAALEAAEAPAGHVLHVSSMSAHRPPSAADLGVYAASKVALKALADAARAELRAAKRPYRVSCLSPGLVETDFYVAKAGPHAAGLVYAAADTLAARDVVDAALFLLTAPPHVEVADLLINPVRAAEDA